MPDYYYISPQRYDDQFWWKKDDLEFWKSKLLKPNKNILELGAGTGRIANVLMREGAHYTGIDISSDYVNYANSKLNQYTNNRAIICKDMKTFHLHKRFDFIFIAFNSFLHLLKENDAIQCLKQIKKHMHDNSILYIDILIPRTEFLDRSKKKQITIMEYHDSKLKEEVLITENLSYDNIKEIANIDWNYSIINKKYHDKFNFKMKMYYPDTMNKILIDNKFIITNLWGSYREEPLNEDSSIQIYECKL